MYVGWFSNPPTIVVQLIFHCDHGGLKNPPYGEYIEKIINITIYTTRITNGSKPQRNNS